MVYLERRVQRHAPGQGPPGHRVQVLFHINTAARVRQRRGQHVYAQGLGAAVVELPVVRVEQTQERNIFDPAKVEVHVAVQLYQIKRNRIHTYCMVLTT